MSLKIQEDEIAQWIKNGINKTLGISEEVVKHSETKDIDFTPEDRDESYDRDLDMFEVSEVSESLGSSEVNETHSIIRDVNQNNLTMSDYNYLELAEKYKSDVDTVREAVSALEAEIKAALPNESEEVYKFLVLQDIGGKFSKSDPLQFAKENADEFNGIIIAISNPRDLNDYQKRQSWKAFNDNPKSGTVRLEKDDNGVERKIALDMEEKLRDGSPNPNYGKPIPYKRARELFVVLDNGEFALVRMDVDTAKIGQKSTIYGKKSAATGKPYKSVIRGWHGGYEEAGVYNNTWTLAEKLYDTYTVETKGKDADGNYATKKHNKVSLGEVGNLPSYGYYMLRGYVDTTKDSEDGTKIYLTISDDAGNKVKSSCKYAPVMLDVDDLAGGDEVIITIERRSFRNDSGDYVAYNTLMGVVKNSAKSPYSDAMKRLREKRGTA